MAGEQQQDWVQTLINNMQQRQEFCGEAIEAFQTRQLTEQAELAELAAATAENDIERADHLRWTLASIQEEIEGLQQGQSRIAAVIDRIHAAVAAIKRSSSPLPSDLNLAALHEVKNEVRRVRRVFTRLGHDFHIHRGVSAKAIRFVESVVGFSIDPHLKALWRLTNGSSDQYWFTNGEDDPDPDALTLCVFLGLSEALLRVWDPISERCDEGEDEGRSPRIQPEYLRHRLWFPFANERNGTRFEFDADPTPAGKYGQILEFVHDPDTIWLVSDNFIEFFRNSNRLLEETARSHTDTLRERLRP